MRLDALEGAIVPGRFELPPSGFQYKAFTDPSGGSQDAFTLAVGHREAGRVVLDCLRRKTPPFNAGQVVKEFSDILKTYSITKVTGDRYAGEWPAQEFQKHGIYYEQSPKSKSDLYLEFEVTINSGRVELLDNKQLFSELRGLERRTGRAGKDSVDHGPRGCDDVSNVVCGLSFLLADKAIKMPPPAPSWGYCEGDRIPTMEEILNPHPKLPESERWILD